MATETRSTMTAPTTDLATWTVQDLVFRAGWASFINRAGGINPWVTELQNRFGVIEGADMMIAERRAIEAERAAA